MVDDGRYYCAILDKNQEVLEKYPADLYVYQNFETGRSWRDIIENSEPVKGHFLRCFIFCFYYD